MTTLELPPTRTHGPQHMWATASRGRSWLGALAVSVPPMLLTLAVTVAGIGARSLWNDEYATWYASTLSFADLRRLLGNVDAVVAPYYLLMHGWIAVFGDSPASLRMPAAIAMAAASAFVALLGRRLFDAGAGVTAGLLCAGLPAVSRYGQEARPYAFAIAFATLSALLLTRAAARPTWRRWIGYGVGLVACACVHIVTLTVVPAHAAYMWLASRSRGDFRQLRWFAGVAIGVTGALPLAAKGHTQDSAISWIKLNGTAIAQLPAKVFGSVTVAAVVAGAAVVAAALLWRRRRDATALLLTWALFPPLFCLVTFPVLHLFLHRYLLFTLPAWALLAAASGFALVRRTRVLISLTALAVVAVVFAVGVPGQQAARHSPVLGEPDFRSAAKAVQGRARPGDGIAFAGASRNGRRAFDYETRDSPARPKDVLVFRTAQQNGEFGAQDCKNPGRCAGDTKRLWLITATESYQDPLTGMAETSRAYLNAAFSLSEVQRLEHVRVFLLTRKA